MATYDDFFADVLNGLGVPVTAGALLGIADVVNEEGQNSYYNPFNIEWHPGSNTAWQGVSNFNSVGVQEYGSYQQGVDATVAFLQGNSGWQPFINALKTGDKSAIDQAFTNVYSWAPFRSTTISGDQAILAKSIGSGTPGQTSVITTASTKYPPPYDPTKLKEPLSATQRAAIITWFTKLESAGQWPASDKQTTPAALAGYSDTQLIGFYQVTYWDQTKTQGTITQKPDWLSELGTALGWLTTAKNWQRIGLFALGAIILLVIAIEFFKPDNISPEDVAALGAL